MLQNRINHGGIRHLLCLKVSPPAAFFQPFAVSRVTDIAAAVHQSTSSIMGVKFVAAAVLLVALFAASQAQSYGW
jgi:hypothetical protein